MDEPTDEQVDQLPSSYSIDQDIDWNAPHVPVALFVELPYWLMVSDCTLQVAINQHVFEVDVRSDYFELYANEVLDSRRSRLHIGAMPAHLSQEAIKVIEENRVPVLPRKCKTVLKIHSTCNEAVIADEAGEARRANMAKLYLRSFCEGHLGVINKVVQQYRLLTYDYFPYEVSPWDVPAWLIDTPDGGISVTLLNYAGWDRKPQLFRQPGQGEEYVLTNPPELQAGMETMPTAGEFELLDALNLMERGDYSGAVRRITTAIEAVLEAVLRAELLKKYSEADVEQKLDSSKNDFPGRFRQYQKLSGRTLSTELTSEMDTTRDLRHRIVHRGYRITYPDRGQAQRSVDTGRWIFNWFEDRDERKAVREGNIAQRSFGRHVFSSLFRAEITPDGVVVHGF